jgi:hypothetical protein
MEMGRETMMAMRTRIDGHGHEHGTTSTSDMVELVYVAGCYITGQQHVDLDKTSSRRHIDCTIFTR